MAHGRNAAGISSGHYISDGALAGRGSEVTAVETVDGLRQGARPAGVKHRAANERRFVPCWCACCGNTSTGSEGRCSTPPVAVGRAPAYGSGTRPGGMRCCRLRLPRRWLASRDLRHAAVSVWLNVVFHPPRSPLGQVTRWTCLGRTIIWSAEGSWATGRIRYQGHPGRLRRRRTRPVRWADTTEGPRSSGDRATVS